MALTQLQLERYFNTANPKETLYQEIRGIVNMYEQTLTRFELQAEWLALIEPDDATALGVDASLLSVLNDFRNVLNEMVARKNFTTPSTNTDPRPVMLALRNLNVI